MAGNSPEIRPVRDVVLAVIVRDRRVLIARRRAGGAFAGYWELPGGKRQPAESVLDCLAREVREELAIAVRPGHEFPPIIHAYPDKTVRLLAIACQIDPDATPRPLAAEQLQWATPGDLQSRQFPPANGPLMERIIEFVSRSG